MHRLQISLIFLKEFKSVHFTRADIVDLKNQLLYESGAMLRTLVWLNLILVASFSIPARSHASALKRLMILDTPVCATLLKSMTGIREALRESEGPLDQGPLEGAGG